MPIPSHHVRQFGSLDRLSPATRAAKNMHRHRSRSHALSFQLLTASHTAFNRRSLSGPAIVMPSPAAFPGPASLLNPAYPPSVPPFPHESSAVSAPHHGGTPDALRLAPCTFLIVLPHRDRHVFSACYQSNAETGGYQSANTIVRVMQASFPLLPPCPTSAVI